MNHIPPITPEELTAQGVVSAPDVLTGTPQENKAKFDNLVANYVAGILNQAIEAVNTLLDSDDVREENEDARMENEDVRVVAESARVSAEQARVLAEAARVAAEEARALTEAARSAAESSRSGAEAGRVTAENARVAVEGARVLAENARVAAEQARTSAETLRASAETTRKQQETARQTQETARVSQEGARQSSELGRSNAETQRLQSETARQSGESGRTAAESARATAEGTRGAAETARQTREGQRETAEQLRATAEQTREETVAAMAEIGPYDETVAYVVHNRVTYQGSSYECIQDCLGVPPDDVDHWLCIARRGLDGTGAGDMLAEVYDPQGKSTDVFAYADTAAAAAGATAVPLAQKGTPDGVATLDTSGKVPSEQLPAMDYDASGTAAAAVAAHNTSQAAHADIREAIVAASFPDVTQAEAEAGTGTAKRSWTPLRVAQAARKVLLTGLTTAASSAIAATDTLLSALAKLQAQTAAAKTAADAAQATANGSYIKCETMSVSASGASFQLGWGTVASIPYDPPYRVEATVLVKIGTDNAQFAELFSISCTFLVNTIQDTIGVYAPTVSRPYGAEYREFHASFHMAFETYDFEGTLFPTGIQWVTAALESDLKIPAQTLTFILKTDRLT